jgi:hypothetical protein
MEWSWGALTAIAAIVTLLVVLGGVLVRLVNRINENELSAKVAKDEALSAALCTTGLKMTVESVQKELTEHRVAVARDYVSKDTMATMENRILKAIEGLGLRLDGLFNSIHDNRNTHNV